MSRISSWANLDFKNHVFFNSIDSINNLIKPIADHFGLDSFNYHKTFWDNSQIRLTNQPDWYEYYLSNKLYLQSIFELPSVNYSKARIIWSNVYTHNEILRHASQFGIKHGITIIEPQNDGYEFYFLGSTIKGNEVINKYLNNFKLLEKFIENLQTTGKELFLKLNDSKVTADDWAHNKLDFKLVDHINNFAFLSEIYNYKFTNREMQCLPLILKGNTSKQIAEALNLSYRTIEDYIDSIKLKTGAMNKNELILLLNEKFT